MQLKSSRGVQQHEVDAAADALLAERLRPTVERVRLKMGRGSPNTVAPMLEAWFADLARRLGVVASEVAPAGPPAAVRQGMQQLWDLALQAARDEAAEMLAAERQVLTRERNEVAAMRSDLSGQLAAAEQRANLLQESLLDARRQVEAGVHQLRDTQSHVLERDHELAEARASIASLVEQKDAAARDHAKHLQRIESERTKSAERAAATERRLLEEVDRARQELKIAHKAGTQLEAKLAQLREASAREREQLANGANELRVDRARLAERLDAAERRIKELQAMHATVAKAKPTRTARRGVAKQT